MLADDFLGTMEAGGKWDSVLKLLKEKRLQIQEFYILQNYSSKPKEKLWHSKIKTDNC